MYNIYMVMNRARRVIFFVLAFCVSFVPASVYALSEEDLYNFAQNGIYFYDPDGGSCVGNGLSYATAAASYGSLSANQVAFIETYHDIAVQNSINYGIPWETVMAQGIQESGAGTSNFAKNRNNFFGLGAYDSNPNNAYSYATPEEGWEGYYQLIQRVSVYRQHGVFAGDTVTDPYAYLRAIKEAGYASDPNYVSSVSKFIAAIEDYSKSKGWPSSAELANTYPEWRENAERNRQGVEADAPSGKVSICGGGNLISGGMTLEEAEAFMEGYSKEAGKKNRGSFTFDGASVSDSGCIGGTMNNCSAFTQWFSNRYTTMGPSGAIIHQGSMAVKRYLSENSDLIDGGKVPRPYAIMSQGPQTGYAEGWGNHTGIVLGIDKEKNKIIIGEASCSMSFLPRAHEYDLDKYTNNPSQYGPTYAYTDNILKGF